MCHFMQKFNCLFLSVEPTRRPQPSLLVAPLRPPAIPAVFTPIGQIPLRYPGRRPVADLAVDKF